MNPVVVKRAPTRSVTSNNFFTAPSSRGASESRLERQSHFLNSQEFDTGCGNVLTKVRNTSGSHGVHFFLGFALNIGSHPRDSGSVSVATPSDHGIVESPAFGVEGAEDLKFCIFWCAGVAQIFLSWQRPRSASSLLNEVLRFD